jgi:hypothetical protein
MEEARRGDEEHASCPIFSKGRGDVTGDHAGFGKDLDFSVNETLYAIVRCNPEDAMGIFVHSANAFIEPAGTLADIDSPGPGTVEDAASVGADPKVVIAAIKHCVDGLILDETIPLNGNILKALAVKGSEAGRGSHQQNTTWPLRYHAHIVFGQAVFYLPVLFLILRKTQGSGCGCGAGDERGNADEKRRDIAEYETRNDARPRPSSSGGVRGIGFHGHRPGLY